MIKKPFIERRKGHDFWFIALRSLAILGWIIFVVAMLISHYALPEQSYGVVRYHNLQIREFWQYPLTTYLFVFLWFNAIVSIVSIVINHYRSRRAEDISGYNSILLLLITITWLIYLSFNIS